MTVHALVPHLVAFLVGCALTSAAWLVGLLFLAGDQRQQIRTGEVPGEAPEGVPEAELLVAIPPRKVLIFKISRSPALIGRARDNDIVIPSTVPGWESVSRHHALLHYNARRVWWVIRDLGSRNGVYVDGSRTGHNVLRDGTQVQLGSVQAVFRHVTQ